MKKFSLRRVAAPPPEALLSANLAASPRMRLNVQTAPGLWALQMKGYGPWQEDQFAAALDRWTALIPWLRASFSAEGQALCIHKNLQATWTFAAPAPGASSAFPLWHIYIEREASAWTLHLKADRRLGDPRLWQEWLSALMELYRGHSPALQPAPAWSDLAALWNKSPAASPEKSHGPTLFSSSHYRPAAAAALESLATQRRDPALWAAFLSRVLRFLQVDDAPGPRLFYFESDSLSPAASLYPLGQELLLPADERPLPALIASLQQELAHPPRRAESGAKNEQKLGLSCAFSLLENSREDLAWQNLPALAPVDLHIYVGIDARAPLLLLGRAERFSQAMLEAFAQAFNETLADLPRILEASELLQPAFPRTLKALSQAWDKSARSWSLEGSLTGILDSRAAEGKFAARIALETATERLSYGELEERSRRLAAALQARGVGPGDFLGIALPRGPDLIIALLAVLRTGAAYVPLDPSFPEERLRFMLADASVKMLIASPELLALAPPEAERISREELLALCQQAHSKPWREPHFGAESPAYVIYTSGSTGQPKGVMLSHRSVLNFLFSMSEAPGMTQADSILAVTTISFDIAVLEIFLPLLQGARLYLASQEEARDGQLLAELLQTRKITHFQATPSTFRLLIEAGWRGGSLRKALCGGEAFPASMVRQLLPLVPEVWNMYGPTETTVWSSLYRLTGEETMVPIGRAIANTRIFILDAEQRPLPPGQKGEICIAGAGLALGYLKRPELNAERFIEPPALGEQVYRTGDIGRFRWDGVLEIFGRADQQVKLRGYRIELGEIEAVLSHLPGVEHAVVLVQNFGDEDQRLVAYIQSASVFDEKALRQAARLKLPAYMLPQHYLHVAAFPLTPNGKIDRKQLPHPLAEPSAQAPASDRVAKHQLWPLTPSQARMLYVENFDPGTRVHHLLAAWAIEGSCDRSAFQKAFYRLIAEQEGLRSVLNRQGEGFEVAPPFEPELNHERLAPGVSLEAHLHAISREALDLYQLPNFRAGFVSESSGRLSFYLLTHHIFWDGFSYSVLWRQLQTHYRAVLDGSASRAEPLPYNFSHYTRARRAEASSSAMDEQLRFWQKRFATLPDPLELAYDFPRPKDLAHRGSTVWIPWEPAFDQKLQDFCKSRACTPYQLLLSALFACLHRLSGQDDLVIGSPVHGRQSSEVFDLVGNFINVLALRASCQPEQSFSSLLDAVKRSSQEAMAYTDLPFEELVAQLKLPRDPSRTPLYTCMLFFQDMSQQALKLGTAKVEAVPLACQTVDTDLVFWIERHPHATFAGLNYRSDLWEEKSAQAMALAFRSLLGAAIEAAERPLIDLPLLPSAPPLALAPARSSLRSPPPAAELSTWLSLIATQHPAKIATRCLGSRERGLSFSELEAETLRLAAVLQARGVKRGSVVGVCLNRELHLLIALRAILRLGAAYLPLDPLYPADRLQFMVSDSGCQLVLGELEFKDLIEAPTLFLDREWSSIKATAPLAASAEGPRAEDLAYIIYTSGSTGKPKGVEIQHAALVHFLQAIQEALELPEGLRTLAITTISFDISVLEIFATWTRAGTVVLVAADRVNDGAYLSEALTTEKIDLLQATPATWRLLLGGGWVGAPHLCALTGGEALTRDLARELQPRVGQLWNVYGPTEATVWATAERIVDPEAAICIGRPLPGYEALVLDARGRPVPQGVIGQLFLGGPALARGYRFRSELTAERFVASRQKPGARIYDTGDLVRVRPDGRLEYISRRDNQVKLRGYRIELGEIEAAMMGHPALQGAACIVHERSSGDQRLVAYVVLHPGQDLGLSALQQHLAQQLPKYMLPQDLVVLERFPRTGSGKLDKKALPPPKAAEVERQELGIGHLPASSLSPEEGRIAAIFSELLGRSGLRASDNFFDLGGHSLLALRVLHRCQEELGLPLKIRDLLLLNIGQLAALLPTETLRPAAGSPGERR